MIVEFDFPDDLLQQTIKDQVISAINGIVSTEVRIQVGRYRATIEKAVDLHLAKRLTNEDIKKEIDNAIAQRIREALE